MKNKTVKLVWGAIGFITIVIWVLFFKATL